MKLEKGTTVSHYRILSEIGKGGMGEVHLAQDTKLNRKVAIKFLSDEFSRDTDKLNRSWFLHQVRASQLMAPLRGDPRFNDLLKRMDLPE